MVVVVVGESAYFLQVLSCKPKVWPIMKAIWQSSTKVRLVSADVQGLKIAYEPVTAVRSWSSPKIPIRTCWVQSRRVLRKDSVLKSVLREDTFLCACLVKNSGVFSYHWQDQTHICHGFLFVWSAHSHSVGTHYVVRQHFLLIFLLLCFSKSIHLRGILHSRH